MGTDSELITPTSAGGQSAASGGGGMAGELAADEGQPSEKVGELQGEFLVGIS